MGQILAKLFGNKPEVRVIMIGLDSSGKTTILYKLKLKDTVITIPTIGFNVENIKFGNLDLNIWDIGGQDKIRPLWRHYYNSTDGIIYVVDSADTDRIQESSLELEKVLKEPMLNGIPLLVFANKQDLPNPTSVRQLTDKLNLHNIRDRKWYVQGSSATSGDGIIEGFKWLSKTLNKN